MQKSDHTGLVARTDPHNGADVQHVHHATPVRHRALQLAAADGRDEGVPAGDVRVNANSNKRVGRAVSAHQARAAVDEIPSVAVVYH